MGNPEIQRGPAGGDPVLATNLLFLARDRARFTWGAQAGPVRISLVDALGHELRRWLLPSGRAAFDVPLSGLPAGSYVVEVMSRAGSGSVKLLIE